MSNYSRPYLWKQMPFVRLLIPFIAGILLQWYVQVPVKFSYIILATSLATIIAMQLVKIQWLYRLRWIQGMMIHLLMIALGMAVTWQQDVRNQPAWIGHYYADTGTLVATINEPLVEKERSYKAEASVKYYHQNGWMPVAGKIIIYFQKDSAKPAVDYGSQILFSKKLQFIKNSGNPGAFDYARYNAFKDIHHQVFIKKNEYRVLPGWHGTSLDNALLSIRNYVLDVLRKHIDGYEECGVAEALLVGYRNDLDKNLVQAYSNTGVVHIIAISGLHLGMIYGILLMLLKNMDKGRLSRIMKTLVMLFVLWTFCLVAGAAPSIVRSAIMFSFVVVGQLLQRKSSIYNTLAGAAFVMLVHNPFYFWDVGFQLSFLAVLSIVTFMMPVYKLLYLPNKLLDGMWKLSSVTLSAQVLTTPIIFYYFQQFPLLFMVSNFIAVPLSTVILYLQLLLVIVSPIETLAHIIGNGVYLLIYWLNSFIKHIDQLPFAVYENVQVNLAQTHILFALIIAISCWLLRKWQPGVIFSFMFLLAFIVVETWEDVKVHSKQKLVVYHVPKHMAIDVIDGSNYQFVGDSMVALQPMLNNFHLKPARIQYRLNGPTQLPSLVFQKPFIYFGNKKILVVDRPYQLECAEKIRVDMVLISGNPKVYITALHKAIDCDQYVFDGTNPQWKINLWKKDCDSLHLRHHSTADKGAFVLEL